MASKSTIDVKILGDNRDLSKALKASESQVGAWSGKIGKLGLAAAAAVGAAAVGAAVGLFKLGSSFDEQFDKIRVGTGATGDALLGLQDSFNNVLSTVPASFEDAGSAIADLNTRLGLTGKPLEDLAGQFINLSRITGTDVASNVDNLTRTFGDWGVSVDDQAATLDKLYRASQASGIGIDELSQSIVTAGAPLRNLGFNLDESAALLAQFNKTGVNTDTVIAGLKAGVGKLAKAGEDVPETFSRIVDEITAMGPGTEATGLAIELFGQRAGPDMADAIAGGKFAIDDMLAAIQNGEDTINGAAAETASFSEKWLLFKNRVLVGLQPLAMKVFNGVGDAMDTLGPKVEQLIGWFRDKLPPVVAKVRDLFEKNWPKIRKAIGDVFDWLVANVVPKVTAAFDRIVDGAKGIYNFFNDNRNALVGVLVAITAGFVAWGVSAAAAAVATLAAAAPFIAVGVAVAAAAGAIGWAYQNVEWFREAIDATGRFLTDTLWPILQDVFGWMKTNVPPILAAVADAFTVVWKFIQDKVLPILKVLVETYIKAVITYFGFLKDVVMNVVIPALQSMWSFFQDKVLPILKVLVETYITAVITYFGFLRDVVMNVVIPALTGMWNFINDKVIPVLQVIGSTISTVATTVGTAVGDIVGFVTGVAGRIFGAAYSMFDQIRTSMTTAKDWVSNRIDDVVGFVTGLPGRISSAASGLFDGFKDAFRSALNWIIDKWNGLEFTLPSISAFGQTIGGNSFGTPDIQRFHEGIDRVPGRRGSEMLAILEAGERVIPASQNTGMSSGAGPITLIIEGRPFTAMIAEHEAAQVAQLRAGMR